VLVFSQFHQFPGDRPPNGSTRTKSSTNTSTARTRDRPRRWWTVFQNDPECKLFLISLKAGGPGPQPHRRRVRLPARSLVEPWPWKPQAIGPRPTVSAKTRQVFAYRLIAKDTVEEKVLQLQQTKARPGRCHHRRRQQPDRETRKRRTWNCCSRKWSKKRCNHGTEIRRHSRSLRDHPGIFCNLCTLCILCSVVLNPALAVFCPCLL